MKVAIFSGFFLPFLGGIERYTSKLSDELIKIGYDVIIVTTNHAELPSREAGNPTIYRLPTYGLFKNRYPIIKKNDQFRKIMNQIESEQIDYVICNTRFQLTTLLGARFAKKHGIKPIVIEHGSSHFSVGNKILDIFGVLYEHCLTSLVKVYVKDFYGVSGRCNQWLMHYHINAKGVFYNSVDSDTYSKFKSAKYKRDFGNKTVISYAGRIIREKGVEMLLESFIELNDENTVLVVAGDGPLLPFLKDKYNNSRIFFEGRLDYEDTMKLLGRTDIFCYPSMYPEGLPTSILEAGIMRSAVIATDRGGTKEVIISPEYGIIVKEDEKSLEKALEDLIGDPSRTIRLKDNLHKRIKNNFTWKTTAKEVDRVLKGMSDE